MMTYFDGRWTTWAAAIIVGLAIAPAHAGWAQDGSPDQVDDQHADGSTSGQDGSGESSGSQQGGQQEDGQQQENASQGSSLRRGNRMEFDARLIRGESAGSGAVFLFERAQRPLPSMVDKRTSFLDGTVESVLGKRWAHTFDQARHNDADSE